MYILLYFISQISPATAEGAGNLNPLPWVQETHRGPKCIKKLSSVAAADPLRSPPVVVRSGVTIISVI